MTREEIIETSARYATRTALNHGFSALGKLESEALLECVKAPVLRRFALEHDPEAGALLLGATGIGKSSAAVCVLRRFALVVSRQAAAGREHIFKGESLVSANVCAMVRALDLPLARLQQSLGDGEAELVELAKSARLLVLDDLGWESQRAGAADVVVEVIARRYDQGAVTICTSGLTLPCFVDRYGEAVVRRICEAGGASGKVLDLWPRETRQ